MRIATASQFISRASIPIMPTPKDKTLADHLTQMQTHAARKRVLLNGK
jgi:hypothetical protein